MTRLRLFTLVAIMTLAAILVPAASAANWPDAKIDAAASTVAGKPVTVWCEDNWASWIHTGDYFGEDWSYIVGFTFMEAPTIYISPQQCETLHALAAHENIGTYHASLALLVLAHEAVHQRGVDDEGAADCTALPLVPGLAISHFGITRTVRQPYTAKTRRGTVVRYRQVANPWLKRLAADALRWHRTAPPEYQGGC